MSTANTNQTRETTIEERLAVRVRRVEGLPVVAIRVWLRGGSRTEEIPGQACLTGRMLTEGTQRRDWRDIAQEAEAQGAILSSFGTLEAHGLNLDALAQDWELALGWAAELMLEASFPESRCTWLRRQATAELESLADRPEVKTSWGFLSQLYSPHAAGRPIQGSAATLAELRPKHCAAFHKRALQGGGVVSVAGEVDEALVLARLEDLFSDLAGPGNPIPEPPSPRGLHGRRQTIETGGREQAQLYAGHLTVPRQHPDLAALEIASVIMGSGPGLSGRIPARIREQEGLAYSAHASLTSAAGLDPGHALAYVGTAPETVEKALAGVEEEFARMVEDGIEDQELEEARAFLLGREPFRRETARQWADLMAEARFYGLPIDLPNWRADQLQALDRSAVEEAVRRHLLPDRLKVTVGMPETRG